MSFKNTKAFRRLAFALVALALAVALAPAVSAQTSGASLAGQVKDKDGAALPGVTVSVSNPDTGFDRRRSPTRTAASACPSLPIGTYTVKAELSGFATVTARIGAPQRRLHAHARRRR